MNYFMSCLLRTLLTAVARGGEFLMLILTTSVKNLGEFWVNSSVLPAAAVFHQCSPQKGMAAAAVFHQVQHSVGL